MSTELTVMTRVTINSSIVSLSPVSRVVKILATNLLEE